MKVFRVQQSSNGLRDLESIVYADEEDAIIEASGLIRETPAGGCVLIEIEEMTDEEYNALPEGEW